MIWTNDPWFAVFILFGSFWKDAVAASMWKLQVRDVLRRSNMHVLHKVKLCYLQGISELMIRSQMGHMGDSHMLVRKATTDVLLLYCIVKVISEVVRGRGVSVSNARARSTVVVGIIFYNTEGCL